MKIITTTELQKNIGQFSKDTMRKPFIVTSRGKAKLVILPYFDDNDDCINDYQEQYEMQKNKEALKKRYTQSLQSSESSLII